MPSRAKARALAQDSVSHPLSAGASISALARAGGLWGALIYCICDYPGLLLASFGYLGMIQVPTLALPA